MNETRKQSAAGNRDHYPTPPWVTRALWSHVGEVGGRVWEPAAGEGHMAAALGECPRITQIYASDLHPAETTYMPTEDFLADVPGRSMLGIDWIITNPPYALGTKFMRRALDRWPRVGVAMLLPINYLSGKERHETIYTDPDWHTSVLIFTQRINMERGVLTRKANSKMCHVWAIWTREPRECPLAWVQHNARELLERDEDYENNEATNETA